MDRLLCFLRDAFGDFGANGLALLPTLGLGKAPLIAEVVQIRAPRTTERLPESTSADTRGR